MRISPYPLLAVLAALSVAHAAPARTLQQVRNTGTLRVGVTLFAPWAARAPNGDLIGFEVDVAKQLAADMGVKAEVLPYELGRLIPALESGEIDVIAAGLTITPERALHVNFSDPYAEGGIALATHSQKTAKVVRLDDLNNAAYKIAAVDGSVAQELARRLLPRAELKPYESVDAASTALLKGEVDAYLEDEPVPTFLALENPQTVDVPIDRPLLVSKAGFAVSKGDPDFLAFLNAWIVARDADTWLPTTAAYWFKSLRWRDRLGDLPHR
jgi:polar amino acid transport system substrate-binding protein